MRIVFFLLLSILISAPEVCLAKKSRKPDPLPSLDEYLATVRGRTSAEPTNLSPGSLYTSGGRLADGSRDLRASQRFDLVTIVVADKASALSSGVTNTDRKSSAKATINSLAGPVKVAALSNLANLSGETQLQGQGTTSRQSSLTTTVTAQVTDVLPNGNLVVMGQKEIMVNSERQVVTVRGIIRPDDLSPVNSIPSDRLAMLEVHVNGKGVVEDAVKRPFILYRILLGLLPF
ncbi:MAG: flagellar basal body L-ring protein FlgH [Bryobacteraceae bacterium]